MATSRRRAPILGAVLAVLVASATVAVALATGAGARHDSPARASATSPGAIIAGLGPEPAPSGWPSATIASGFATIPYPRGWQAIAGDRGTVSFALRDRAGHYLGYLNVTPHQGGEQLSSWARFRLGRNRGEGDRNVALLASRRGVPFAGARGTCVIDDYSSRVGANPYRELACLVRGRRSASVLVASALRPDWARIAPLLVASTAAFVER
ncbi:MAG TPA: hypothetical protein VNV44_05790 [Solirubrobacteraceae bacterium]|jgi:hypothetical protein|nr:hypothetical protein [Solirubrobacteraceae bacterium]